MTINDVLPLKTARLDAIANKNVFGAPGHQRPNVDGFIYIHYAAPPYTPRISVIYRLPFGKVWLTSICWALCATATPRNKAERRIYGQSVKCFLAV